MYIKIIHISIFINSNYINDKVNIYQHYILSLILYNLNIITILLYTIRYYNNSE